MGSENPDMRMIMNQKALTNWKKLAKEWNRLLTVSNCCEPVDGTKNFNRMVSVQSYFGDRPMTPELSYYLTKMYPNTGVILFAPQGWSLLRTFDKSIGENLNVVNGTNINFMSIKEIDTDDNEFYNCERALKVQGSYLVAHAGLCTGKYKMIV